ncbi:MAG TPA: molybdopterin converting factor subunit 1 [Longimicrobiaceae bacterium]|nr:molybdopterin converting factor subunit 1 [Longimicrobiaceae bacterium]
MNVRALFFASYRDLAGTDELAFELPAGSDVAVLVQRLRAAGAGWQALPPAPVVAVNMTYASLATPLSEGDEVAFIPPVSGG